MSASFRPLDKSQQRSQPPVLGVRHSLELAVQRRVLVTDQVPVRAVQAVGLGMTWSDWVINHEDVLFHLALTTIMPLLARIGYGVVWLTLLRNSLAA